ELLRDPDEVYRRVQAAYREQFGVEWMEPLGFTDQYDIQNGGWCFYRLRSKGGGHTKSMSYLPGTEGLLAIGKSDATRKGAIEKFEQLVKLAPGVASFRSALGALLVDDRQWQKSVAHLEWGIANGLPLAETHGKFGIALWNLARYWDAEVAFARAATLHPWDRTFRQWRDKCAAAAEH
ncbi:MAG: hypothetical protein IIA14_05585, partial [SAR324 cluster bacterium]|nr:hypothetical protein [SAR324 cluster bacterium]